MSWGTELWDQPENLEGHVSRGIDLLETYSSFLKDRAQVEQEYAKSIRSLTKKYLAKKKLEDDQAFTYVKAFHGVFNELNDVASQHEVVADRLKHDIGLKIHDSVKELRELRRQSHEEIRSLQCNLDHQINTVLGRAKSDYIKAWKEARVAEQKFQKADLDMNLSRLEVERSKNLAITKGQYAEKAKHSYALQLQTTNELQKQHYQTLLPEKLETLRKLDERRINLLQHVIEDSVMVEKQVSPLLEKCMDGMLAHAHGISEQKDILHVIALYRSGYTPPQDLEFLCLERDEDLEDSTATGVDSSDIGTYSSPPQVISKIKSIKSGGTLRIKFSKKSNRNKGGPPEPPQQKVNRIQNELSVCQEKLLKLSSELDGLTKLEKVYQQDPAKGDLGAVQRARQAAEADVARLDHTVRQLESEKTQAEHELNTPIDVVVKDTLRKGSSKSGILRMPSIINNRSSMRSTHGSVASVSDGPHHNGSEATSARAEASDCDGNSRSSTDTFDSGPMLQHNEGGVGASPGRGGPAGGPSAPVPPAFSMPSVKPAPAMPAPPPLATEAEYNVVADAADQDKVLGHAVAEYTFNSVESGSENTISIQAGEHMDILENDDGDGWTRVRTSNGDEGFVPTAYLAVS